MRATNWTMVRTRGVYRKCSVSSASACLLGSVIIVLESRYDDTDGRRD